MSFLPRGASVLQFTDRIEVMRAAGARPEEVA
jgi:hypothetical protein